MKHETEIESISAVENDETPEEKANEEAAFWFSRGRNVRRGIKRYFPQSQRGNVQKKPFMNNKRYTCHNYGSEDHFIRNCPHEVNEQINRRGSARFTGFVQNEENTQDDSFDIFCMSKDQSEVGSKRACIIVDTGATKTVVGECTLQAMMHNIPVEQKKPILKHREKDTENMAKFKFGDGKTIAAQKVAHIPIQVHNRVVKLRTFVMPRKIPFLLGIEALTKM